MRTILLPLNLLVSLASAVAAVIALIRPASFSGSRRVERGELFYARMYAARSIPFGLAAGLLPFRPGGPAVAWVLFTAAVIQIEDVAIAVGKKERGMSIGASVGAIVHLLCGVAIMRAGVRPETDANGGGPRVRDGADANGGGPRVRDGADASATGAARTAGHGCASGA